MENICKHILECCLRGEPWSEHELNRALSIDNGRLFLSTVVEQLGDLFEPRLSATYDKLFTQVIPQVAPKLAPRIRKPVRTGVAPTSAQRVYVLSRITLGADVAVTSVLIAAAKCKYPGAPIYFVGPRKSYELFETDSRILHFPAPYARDGSLAERLKASASLWLDDGLVVDSDSRLTQLGLISVCDEARYLFFPSREYGGDGDGRLPDLAARWAQETFGVDGAMPYVAPCPSAQAPANITVSLGVGDNTAKRLHDDLEKQLIATLAATGLTVLIDKGGDERERERVECALVPGVRTHEGSFASFASLISQSQLYVGYDSAGGHVASACGVPVISIAKGFASPRMAARWRPLGTVIDGDAPDVLAQVRKALATYTSRR